MRHSLVIALLRSAGIFAGDLFWHLRHVRVIVAVLLAIVIGLRFAPQAQDLLVTLGQSTRPGVWGVFVASVLWLGLNTWFWSHVALEHTRHERDPMLLWLPRVLGLAPFLGVALALRGASNAIPHAMRAMTASGDSGAGRLTMAAALIALLGLCLFAGLALRRQSAPPDEAAIGLGGWLLLGLSGIVALAGMAAYGLAPVVTGRILQPAPTVLLAAAGIICGGTSITWYGARSRIPVLALLLLGAYGLAELRDADVIPDNHDIRTLPGKLPDRPDIEAAFARFIAAGAPGYPPTRPLPVVLVATGGGGIAAAFWTATVLGDLADHAPGFASQVFAISGVSGGALGAVSFVAQLRDGARGVSCAGVAVCAQNVLSADFLAPALGRLLYSDLLQRFVPAPLFPDRAAALETAWESSWRSVMQDDLLAQPFLDLWPAGRPWPALLLNSTSMATGGPVVTSNLRLSGASPSVTLDAVDLLRDAGADVRASTAADDSARFPYFGPIGVLRAHVPNGRGPTVDLVADGGYFENFGATTLLDLLDVLHAIAARDGRAVRFIVIQISSDPGLTRAPARLGGGSVIPRGLAGPVVTLLRTRDARGAAATAALARRTAALGGLYVPIRLGFSPTGESAPLGWALSPVARQAIDAQWTPACRQQLIADMALGGAAARPAGDFKTMLRRPACAPRDDGG